MNEAGIRQVLDYLGVHQPARSYRQGSWIIHPCPFAGKTHDNGLDRNPSFGIAVKPFEKSFYNCFTCKQKGLLEFLPDNLARVVDANMSGHFEGVLFVKKLEAESLKDAPIGPPSVVKQIIKPEPLNRAVYENIYDSVARYRPAVEYLKARGITKEAVDYANIMFDPQESRIIFPVYGVDQELYGFTGRTILENWKDFHNPPYQIYPRIKDYHGFQKRYFMLGEDKITKGKPTVVVEGLFGYASLISRGVHEVANVVAILGSNLTPEKADTLIRSNTAIYLVLDNDKAGEVGIFGSRDNGVHIKGAIDYLQSFCPLFIPEWPENKFDPDQLTFEDIQNMLQFTCAYVRASGSNKSVVDNVGSKASKGKVNNE